MTITIKDVQDRTNEQISSYNEYIDKKLRKDDIKNVLKIPVHIPVVKENEEIGTDL